MFQILTYQKCTHTEQHIKNVPIFLETTKKSVCSVAMCHLCTVMLVPFYFVTHSFKRHVVNLCAEM